MEKKLCLHTAQGERVEVRHVPHPFPEKCSRLWQFQAQNQGHKIRKDSEVLVGHGARQRSFPSTGTPPKRSKLPHPIEEP